MADPLRKARATLRRISKPPRMPKPPTLSQIFAQAQRGAKNAFTPSAARSTGRVRIKWNIKAFRELRLEPGVQNYIDQLAADIAARAGNGYEASYHQGKNRARASVITANYAAMRDNARNQTLIRALDAAH